jgi:F0F1-type ATP synthase assembly protein I
MKTPKKRAADQFLKFSGLAFQMALIICVGSYLGNKLDAFFEKETPLYTITFSLLSVFLALYFVLKEIISQSDDT